MAAMNEMISGIAKRVHCWSSLKEVAWLDDAVALFSSSSSTGSHFLSSTEGCLGFFISDMSRNAENDDCFNWMIVFVHGWYVALCSFEMTGFFGMSWRTSQPYCGMVAKNLMRSSSSGLEFSSVDSIDWRLKISQYLEFAIFIWWGKSAFVYNGHKFSISLLRSSKESKLSPSCVRSRFDMPESVGIFSDEDRLFFKVPSSHFWCNLDSSRENVRLLMVFVRFVEVIVDLTFSHYAQEEKKVIEA